MMKIRPDRDHQFQPPRDRRQRRSGRPRVEAGRVDALDVVEIELGDQRDVESDLLAAHGQIAHVSPCRFHALVLDIAQPSAENRQPVSEAQRAHATALRTITFSSASTSFTVGSKPITCTGSATKFESALMS